MKPGARRRRREEERIVPGTPLWDAQIQEHLQRYDLVAELVRPGMRVLDAGCGVGYGSARLADQGAQLVVAVDLSEAALSIAQAQFDRPNIRWVREDCHALGIAAEGGPFDVICNLENLEHLAEPDRFLDRVAELLRPDGRFVSSTPNRMGVSRLRGELPGLPGTNPYHFREFTAAEFGDLLHRHFCEVAFRYQTLDPLERMILEPALTVLWHDPIARAGRWLKGVLRGRPVPGLEHLLPPRRYQLLDVNPGDALVVTQLAICRQPRRGMLSPS